MKSNRAVSYELEDMKIAAAELAKAADGFPLLKNSMGVLYFSLGLNAEKLMAEIKKLLPFDIMGCSTDAVLDGKTGMNEFSSSLIILTADDCDFHFFVSEPFGPGNIKRRGVEVCEKAMSGAAKDAKLVLLNLPFNDELLLNDLPDSFHEATGGKPVFGGCSGFDHDRGYSAVLFNEAVYTDRFVCCFISGGVCPVFSVMGQFSSIAKKSNVVTKSESNVIYTVDDMSFVDYLESLGIATSFSDEFASGFLLGSIVIKAKWGDSAEDSGVYFVLQKLNQEDGSGVFGCRIPQGSQINVTSCKNDDMEISTQICMYSLLEKMREAEPAGYTYSTILCGSCSTRYIYMFPSKDIEGNVIKKYNPPDMNFMGYYTSGEICPVSVKDGHVLNRAHNATITMCAF